MPRMHHRVPNGISERIAEDQQHPRRTARAQCPDLELIGVAPGSRGGSAAWYRCLRDGHRPRRSVRCRRCSRCRR